MIVITMLMVSLTVFSISCKKENSVPDDPEGTVTANINDVAAHMVIWEGLETGQLLYPQYPYVVISINIDNISSLNTHFDITICPNASDIHGENFYSTGGEAADIGKVSGLGNVTIKPNSGYRRACAYQKGHGYVVRFKKSYNQADNTLDYFYGRFYVVDWLISATSGGIIGATIKYQEPF